jgi:hypothetical protein
MKREINYIINHFDSIREKLNAISESDDDSNYRYGEESKRVPIPNLAGQNLLWRTPDVFWVNAYEYVESYDASAIQIGISRDGKLVWESQSHCSCMGWSNSELKDAKTFETFKQLLDAIPHDYEHEAITNGSTPTNMTDVESRFLTTLKGLITLYKHPVQFISKQEGKQDV